MKTKIIETDHLEDLKNIEKSRSVIEREYATIGKLHMEIKLRSEALKSYEDNLDLVEKDLHAALEVIYGKVNINLVTGEISETNLPPESLN